MPGPAQPALVTLRGVPEFGVFLDALAARVGARDRSALVDLALRHLAAAHGLEPPRRCHPLGANRHTIPGRDA